MGRRVPTKRQRPLNRRRWSAFRLSLIGGIAAFILALGGGGAWAYWTTSVSATGSVTTSTASVAHASFPSLSATYLPSSLTSTAPFTVTNTGQIAGTATVQISGSGALAAALPITVWPVTSAANCTTAANVPAGAVTGTWGSPPALTPTLAVGASVIYCVRTTAPDWKTLTSPTGTQSTQPQLNVSLNADGWVATAPTAQHTQQTAGMFPITTSFFDPALAHWFTLRSRAATGICLDVNSGGGSGSGVISWGCHTSSNQRWEFVPVAGPNQSLVTIRPRHAMGTRLGFSGTHVELIQNATGTVSQQWYVQQIPGSTPAAYQLVSAANGRCLSLRNSSSAADMLTVPCNDATAQIVFQREALTFTNGTNIVLGFGGSEAPSVVTLQRQTGPTTWTNVSTAASGALSISFARTTIPNNTTATFRIINASGEVLWDGIQISRSGSVGTPVAGIG